MTQLIPDRSLLEAYFVKNMALRGWHAVQVEKVMFSVDKRIHLTEAAPLQSSYVDVYTALQHFEVWNTNDNQWTMSHDLPILAYLCWTSQEKLGLPTDALGRFMAKAVEQKFGITIQVPYLDIALAKLEVVFHKLQIFKSIPVYADTWWFTSDVDYIHQTWKQAFKHLLLKCNWENLIPFAKDLIAQTIISQPFGYWSSHPKAKDLKPTFFILPEKTFHPNYDSADYEVESMTFKSIIRHMLCLWSNVCFGYHVGLKATDQSTFAIPYRKLNQQFYHIAPIVRHHFLRFDLMQTPEIWDNLGIKVDSTFSYPDKIGFYNATCHPFYIFDIKQKRITQIIEMPLCLMDSTLLYPHHMGLEKNTEIQSAVKQLLDTVLQMHGVFVINLHPNNYSTYDHPKYRILFESIMYYVEYTGCKSLDIRDMMRA